MNLAAAEWMAIALCAVLHEREPELANHGVTVAVHSRQLAAALDLPADDVELVAIASLVHDFGKESPLLHKDEPLSEEESRWMEMHPERGEYVLRRAAAGLADEDLRRNTEFVAQDFEGLGPLFEIVRHHHERWDGTGYPDRLAGEAIPFGARILAVADAFVNLVPTAGPRRGIKQVAAQAGSSFDPEVVRAVKRLGSEFGRDQPLGFERHFRSQKLRGEWGHGRRAPE